MFTTSVGRGQKGEVIVPVSLVVLHIHRDHVQQRAVEPLDTSVGGRVERCRPRLVDLECTADLAKELRLVVPSLVGVECEWNSEPGHELFHDHLGNCLRLEVG